MKRFFTICFVLVLFLVSCSENQIMISETDTQEGNTTFESETAGLPINDAKVKFDTEHMFERNYADYTYDLSYLLQQNENEKFFVTLEELEAWKTEVYDAKSERDKSSLPMLYQAIQDLDITKYRYESVNKVREENGSPFALSEEAIELLFSDINTDYQAVYKINNFFRHPLAYYDMGNIYSCEYVLTHNDPYMEFGYFEMDRYIRNLQRECEPLGIDPIAIYGLKILTIDEMVDIVRDEEGNICKINIEAEYFIDKLSLLGDYDAFPENAYRLNITGFDTEVYFDMESYSHPASLTAYGKTVELYNMVSLYGNCGYDIFEYNGNIIFTWEYYDVGYNYVIGEDLTDFIGPNTNDGLCLRINDEGKLIYRRVNIRMADITQTGGLSSAVGYDAFYASGGYADITDGEIVLHEPFEYYTISDKYDLDEEFETMYSKYYSTIEEVFEKNKELYEANDT